jgi:hypothetical protein
MWKHAPLLAAAVCGALTAIMVLIPRGALHIAMAHVVFAAICACAVLPFVVAVALVGRRWSGPRAVRLAFTVVPATFVGAGLFGWAFVPDTWTASLWVTIDASMNAATYGGQFERLAEHALLYFLYIGILGAFGSTIASIVVPKLSAR